MIESPVFDGTAESGREVDRWAYLFLYYYECGYFICPAEGTSFMKIELKTGSVLEVHPSQRIVQDGREARVV
jgi:hypothetical protein